MYFIYYLPELSPPPDDVLLFTLDWRILDEYVLYWSTLLDVIVVSLNVLYGVVESP